MRINSKYMGAIACIAVFGVALVMGTPQIPVFAAGQSRQAAVQAQLCDVSGENTVECGNITVSVDGTIMTITGSGTLTIGDEGPVDSDGFTYFTASEWADLRDSVDRIVVDDFGVSTISNNAFSKFSGLYNIYVGRGVKTIGSNVFPYDLKGLHLSSTVRKIADDAISGDPTITVYKGSYAQKYVKNKGIVFYNEVADDMTSAQKSGVKKSYSYTGKAIKPKVKLSVEGVKLKQGRDYTVTYKNNVKPGRATIIIKGKGNYSGKCTLTYGILPKKSTITKVSSPKKKSVKALWRKDKLATGYQLQLASNSKFTKSKKTVTVKKNSTVSKTVSGLKTGRKYYVRVRAYKKVGSKAYYGAWSKVKAVKCR